MESRSRSPLLLVTLCALVAAVTAAAVCSNPAWVIILAAFFLGIQSFMRNTYHTFMLNIEEPKLQNAIVLSFMASVVSFLTYLVVTFEASCANDAIPLHQSIPLKMIFILYLLWQAVIPQEDKGITPVKALVCLVLLVVVSACWVVAAASLQSASQWLWWPAIHAVVVDTGIYSVLLVHYAVNGGNENEMQA